MTYVQPSRRWCLRVAAVLGFALCLGWLSEREWVFSVLYLAGGWACALEARAEVVTTDEGVHIRTPYRWRFVRWDEVEGLELGWLPTLRLRSGQKVRLEGVQPVPKPFPTKASRAVLASFVEEVEARRKRV